MWQLFPIPSSRGDLWGRERKSLGVSQVWAVMGLGPFVEVLEEPLRKNRSNSTSLELGDPGARVGPGWVVPAAAGCAPWKGAGR